METLLKLLPFILECLIDQPEERQRRICDCCMQNPAMTKRLLLKSAEFQSALQEGGLTGGNHISPDDVAELRELLE